MLGGIGVQDKHAEIVTSGGQTKLTPVSDKAAPFIYINGEPLKGTKSVTLKPNDRIIFGMGSCFLFREQDKAKNAKIQDTPENPITYEFAMKEKLECEDKAKSA